MAVRCAVVVGLGTFLQFGQGQGLVAALGNQGQQVPLVRAAHKCAACPPLAQRVGQRQAAHDVTRANLYRGIGAEGNVHLWSVRVA